MVEIAASKHCHARGLGDHNLTGPEFSQAARGYPQIALASQQLSFGPIGLQVGYVRQPLFHVAPRTEYQVIPLADAHKALHVNSHRSAAGQFLQQR